MGDARGASGLAGGRVPGGDGIRRGLECAGRLSGHWTRGDRQHGRRGEHNEQRPCEAANWRRSRYQEHPHWTPRAHRGEPRRPAVTLGPPQQRAVLAMLALQVNRTVSTDRLIDGLWDERAPRSAHKLVQLYVSHLRKLLDGCEAEIVTRGRGYKLQLAADQVDAARFERMIGAAVRAGSPNGEVREALALRGAALADVADEPFAGAESGGWNSLGAADASSGPWKAVRYVAVGGPNQLVSASGSPGSVRSPTQPTYPSGRINTAVGAVTAPSTGSSHGPTYWASII
jgi:Transcriptional regulatory protein, C terminal